MSDIDLTLTSSISNDGSTSATSTGFSTPPSSSLDTCDSGIDMYSNNFTMISSMKDKIKTGTASAQINPAESESSSESIQSIGECAAKTSVIVAEHTNDALRTNAATAADRPPPQPDYLYSTSSNSSSNNSNHTTQFDDNQLDLLNSLDYDNGAINSEKKIVSETITATTAPTPTVLAENEGDALPTASMKRNENAEFVGDNYMEDYNDDSVSDISDLSDVFKLHADILPEMQRSIDWVHMQIASGVNPRDYLSRIFVNGPRQTIPENVSDTDLWRVIAAILSDPPQRQRLQHIQTLEQVCETIKNSKNIIVLTGAGVSVSCGIPDFRSRDGIYERLRVEYPNMQDPQSMFDIGYFARDPRPFYQFAKEIYPGQFQPSLSHRFIKLLERKGKLLRNYTQNIDTLERVAGIENVIECHGSFATASCTRCKYALDADAIQDDILGQQIPICKICEAQSTKDYEEKVNAGLERPLNYSQLVAAGIMKPDIVFFGENLPDKFHSTLELDKNACDLLIVIGSSLKVRPVALIPNSVGPSVPQILINREQLDHFVFDVELLGDSDGIINHLCHALGDEWNDICSEPPLIQTTELSFGTNNLHNIPPLLANAVINKPQESTDTEPSESSSVAEPSESLTEKNEIATTSQDTQSDTSDTSDVPDKPVQTIPNFLPENKFYYNGENSYVFPGAEVWWNKDSDLESTSSDSSIENDDEEDDDMDMEMATIDKNEILGDAEIESTLAVDDLIDHASQHEFNKYLLKRNADTSLDSIELGSSEPIDTSIKRAKVADRLSISDETSRCSDDANTS